MKGRNQFYFKACPKCRGDMYLDEDAYSVFTKCLQCGRIFES
jgi:PHP family Zn ribbon phosphoesterase